MIRFITIYAAAFLIVACAVEDTTESFFTETKEVPAMPLSEADKKILCRATVAATMGRDIAIIGVDKFEDNITYVSYKRPSDKTVWKTRCKTSGNKIIWSTVDQEGPGTGFGRWRDHSMDSKIVYSIDSDTVTITEKFPDGSGSPKVFVRDDKK
ncbi:hypothetical protein ACJ3XI_03825 [Litorimonas sp. RW-G-Af-16]|uniref:hypothetical protein n=1 Tax=Litorimonas sp. RW-G-Af-16 TaxID=3241168 RepID=UPI00390CA01F